MIPSLAEVDPAYRCVLKKPNRTRTLYAMTCILVPGDRLYHYSQFHLMDQIGCCRAINAMERQRPRDVVIENFALAPVRRR